MLSSKNASTDVSNVVAKTLAVVVPCSKSCLKNMRADTAAKSLSMNRDSVGKVYWLSQSSNVSPNEPIMGLWT